MRKIEPRPHVVQETLMTEETLDLRGLKCPLPALMTRRHLAKLAPGVELKVLADDPLAVVDIPHMCGQEGHVVIAVNKQDGHHAFDIRAGGQAPETG